MNKLSISIAMVVLCICQAAGQQSVPAPYICFGGDTLNGFDLDACYGDLGRYHAEHHLNEKEKIFYMRHQESAFVDRKYRQKPRLLISPAPLSRSKSGHVPAAGCNNLDFETGDFTGWNGDVGYNQNSGTPLTVRGVGIFTAGMNALIYDCSAHTIVSTGTDPYGNFSMVDSGGGSYAVRLGGDYFNLNTPGCGFTSPASQSAGEVLSQTFVVGKANALFTYNYAVVLQDGGHPNGEQPYFGVVVHDGSGNPIPCLQYYQQCTNGIPPPGYTKSVSDTTVFFSGWRGNSINLSPYLGQTITVTFTAAGCDQGAHFGYAYVDASCGPLQVTTSAPVGCLGSTLTIHAPPSSPGTGFSWTKIPSGPGIVGSSTGPTVTVNTSGTYQVTVTYGACSYAIDTTIVFIPNPVLAATVTNVSCNGANDGKGSITVSGGNAPYTYSWAPNIGSGAMGTGLVPGSYTVWVTNGGGCISSTQLLITQPPALTTLLSAKTNVACNGGNSGSAAVIASGGTPGYTYSWSSPGGTTPTLNGLSAGTYTCAVKDSNSCLSLQVVTLTEPLPLQLSSAQTNPSCMGISNGAVSVLASGGTPGYVYSWSPSGGSASTVNGVSAGTYTCTVEDNNRCIQTKVVTLTEPPALKISATQTNVYCHGGNTGSASVQVSGGTPGFIYSWSGTGGSTPALNNLSAGTYTCQVSDTNGCSASLVFVVTSPPMLLPAGVARPDSCGRGTGCVVATASGGTPPYSYLWNTVTGGTSLNGLTAGNYTCMVTDSLGCQAQEVLSVVSVGSKPVASLSANGSGTFCQGTSVLLTASGGGTYSWSTGEKDDTLRINTSGSYTVYVENGCGTDTASFTAHRLPLTIAAITGPNQVCQGDSVMLMASGGGSYLWSNGSTASSVYVSSGGTFLVTVSGVCGTDMASTLVSVHQIGADFTASSLSGSAPLPVTFHDNSTLGAITWSWIFGDGNTGTGQVVEQTYTATGTYPVTLTITDAFGCTSSKVLMVTVTDLPSWIVVPNVFTPNHDGSNDLFQVRSAGITSFNARIFDRWGVAMAELTRADQGWDGTTVAGVPASNGTYYYIIKAKGDDGKEYAYNGFLMLIQ